MDVKNLLKTAILVLVIVSLFVAPDFLYSRLANNEYHVSVIWLSFKMLVPLSLGLLLNRYRWLTLVILAFLCGLQLMQFARLDYFGRLLTPYDFIAAFGEWRDVALGVCDALASHWKILPIVIIPFGLIALMVTARINKSSAGTAVLLVTLIATFWVNCFVRKQPFPLVERPAIDNSLKSFSLFVQDLFRKPEFSDYLPYEIKNVGIKADEPITIVYIMGEGSNAQHMSLFGYERDTTPSLKSLANSSNFYYTEGISGSICTNASSKFMANVIWEPDNPKMTLSCDTSLCKLAKENGFKVFYITSKYNKMLSSVCNSSAKYIDVIRTRNDDMDSVEQLSDEYMIKILDEQQYTSRNFILLHQRCIHTPYKSIFPKEYEKTAEYTGGESSLKDEYDNAMLYNDSFLSRVFNRFNKQKQGKFYIVFASDHNELHGEYGVHGHGILIPQVADIPVIVQSNDKKFMSNFKKIFKPTHYEIAMEIAKLLGFEIKNPNQKENVFYINGLDYDGRGGYIELTKDLEKKTVSYVTHYRKFHNESRK